jgi:hypothetical protein
MRPEGDMKSMRRALLVMVMATSACLAQNSSIPLKQIEREARDPVLSARSAMLEAPAANVASDAAFSEPPASSGFVQPPAPARNPRTLSAGFLLLNGLHLGMAVFDVEMTQHCIANHHCSEGNPLMPSSHAGQLGVNFALIGYGSYLSYRLKKHDNKLWILSPAAGIAAHALGVASGFKNR